MGESDEHVHPLTFHSFSSRGIAQLVEWRSPKPQAAGSSPAAPALKILHVRYPLKGWRTFFDKIDYPDKSQLTTISDGKIDTLSEGELQ